MYKRQLLTTCTGDRTVSPGREVPPDPPAVDGGQWAPLPTPLLSPRHHAMSASVGREVLFIGGYVEPEVCQGFGPCLAGEAARDGAAYDPATGTWRQIADAPKGVDATSTQATAGDSVVVAAQSGEWLVYDAAADRWHALPSPPQDVSGTSLAADGALVYAVSRDLPGSIQVLDVASETGPKPSP